VERDRLQAERDELRENNNELADQIKIGNNSRLVFWLLNVITFNVLSHLM
jgi:hypothetical protein